jgi:hypothetical protein
VRGQSLEMEPQSAFPDGARLSATITYMSGYAAALVDQRNRADAPQLEKFEEQFGELIERCKEASEKLPKVISGLDENGIRLRLVLAALLGEALRILMSQRLPFLEKNPEAKEFWTEEAQETLEETSELFEDMAETLALGLSSDFHDDVDSSRKEAGINSDAKTGLPTR